MNRILLFLLMPWSPPRQQFLCRPGGERSMELSSHGYGQCAYHIVLVPRYRHKIFLDAKLQKRCEELLRDIAAREGYKVYALKVACDHVHIFLGLKPSHSVSVAMRELKCNSAGILFAKFPEPKKQFWRGHLWSDGKFYWSIGNNDCRNNTTPHQQIETSLASGYPAREGRSKVIGKCHHKPALWLRTKLDLETGSSPDPMIGAKATYALSSDSASFST